MPEAGQAELVWELKNYFLDFEFYILGRPTELFRRSLWQHPQDQLESPSHDLTIILDLPANEAKKRSGDNGSTFEGLSHRREFYLTNARAHYWRVISAQNAFDLVLADAIEYIQTQSEIIYSDFYNL